MNIDYQRIGGRIKMRRKGLKKTQEDLAEYLSVSVGYVSQMERGVTKISLETLSKISSFLQCDMNLLLNDVSSSSANYLNDDFIRQFNRLDKKQKKMIMEIIELFLKYS